MHVLLSHHKNHRTVRNACVTVTPQQSPVCTRCTCYSHTTKITCLHEVRVTLCQQTGLHLPQRYSLASRYILHFHVHTLSHCHHTVLRLHIQTVTLCHHIVLHLPSHTGSLLSSPSFGYHKLFLLQTAAVRIILFALACLDVCSREKRSSDCQFIYHHPPHPRNAQTLLVTITLGLEKIVLRNTPLQ